jgi:hypothetical protein
MPSTPFGILCSCILLAWLNQLSVSFILVLYIHHPELFYDVCILVLFLLVFPLYPTRISPQLLVFCFAIC